VDHPHLQSFSRWLEPLPAWRVALVAVVVAGAAGFTGFGIGRMNALEQVEEHALVLTVTREKTVERWRRAKDRIVYVEKTTSPDGTTVEKRSERETERAELVRDVDRKADTRAETAKVTTSRPDWRIGVQLGATWKEPAVRLGDTPLVVGGSIERRLIGPFSVGAWGSTVGAAGLSVSGEF
jgi:hypothetical protein